MSRIPIGLQLYSVRDDCKRDLPGTLAAVAKMGYDGVEFAGYYGRSAKELRTMLDDLGLKCCGTHTGLDTLLGAELKRTIEFNQELGDPYLIVPWLSSEQYNTPNAWRDLAGVFSDIANKLKPLGMWTGYHSHQHDFEPLEGERPWDTLFGNSSPEVVMQIDLGNCLSGGTDPIPFLEKYPGRAITVHLKEYSKTKGWTIIGDGDVRWQDAFRLCETTGKTEWYIVEQESSAVPPLECVDQCMKALKAMGK